MVHRLILLAKIAIFVNYYVRAIIKATADRAKSPYSTLVYLVIRKTLPKPRFNTTNITASLHL